MTNKPLSGEELVKYFNRHDAVTPSGGGMKDYAPDGSWFQAKRLSSALAETRSAVEEERVMSLHSLSVGEWKPDIKKVLMSKLTGRHWLHMGHVLDKKQYLYPEEAMFLMDVGQLEVQCDGIPLSIQEAYATLLGNHLPISHYQVYAHLARQGYIILRHSGVTDITSYERRLRLDQHSKTGNKKKKRERRDRKRPPAEQPGPSAKQRHLEGSRDNGDMDIEDQVEMPAEFGFADIGSWTDRLRAERPCEEATSEESSRVKYSQWDWDEICFPDCKRDEPLTLTKLSSNLVPPGVIMQPTYRIPPSLLQFNLQGMDYEDHLEYSHGSAGSKALLPARNWGEYKAAYAARAAGTWRELAPTAHLWCDEVTPLVSPEDAFSSACLLEKLQVIQNYTDDTKCGPKNSGNPESKEELRIFYDVYLPSSKFKKSNPGLPSHRVIITNPCDPPPEFSDLHGVDKYSSDGVPILWAVMEGGSVVFYTFSSVELPVDYTMG